MNYKKPTVAELCKDILEDKYPLMGMVHSATMFLTSLIAHVTVLEDNNAANKDRAFDFVMAVFNDHADLTDPRILGLLVGILSTIMMLNDFAKDGMTSKEFKMGVNGAIEMINNSMELGMTKAQYYEYVIEPLKQGFVLRFFQDDKDRAIKVTQHAMKKHLQLLNQLKADKPDPLKEGTA